MNLKNAQKEVDKTIKVLVDLNTSKILTLTIVVRPFVISCIWLRKPTILSIGELKVVVVVVVVVGN